MKGGLVIQVLDLVIKDIGTADDAQYLYLVSVVASELLTAVNRRIQELSEAAGGEGPRWGAPSD